MAPELELRGLSAERKYRLVAEYKGLALDDAYRLDFVVDGRLIVELKCVDHVNAVHRAQLLTYLRWTGFRLGLLLNFDVALMRDGISRVINRKYL